MPGGRLVSAFAPLAYLDGMSCRRDGWKDDGSDAELRRTPPRQSRLFDLGQLCLPAFAYTFE